MEGISKHLEIFFYIAAFFSGISCITFVILFSKRENRKIYCKLIYFLAASFVYLAVNFLQFYKEFFYMSYKMSVVLMLLLDIGLTSLIYCWLLLGRESVYPVKTFRKPVVIAALSIFYIAGWLAIYLFFTDSDYYIYTAAGRKLAVVLDSIFFCGALIYIVHDLVGYFKCGIPFRTKSYLTAVSAIIGIYLIWFYWNDMHLIQFTYGAELWDIYPYDPVILFYVLISITTMIYYYKRNYSVSLSEKGDNVIRKEPLHSVLMSEVSEKYELTKREEEITALAYMGLSNPEIAGRLYISTYTVKRHMQNIFKKMNIRHRSELIHLIKSQ